MHHERFVGGRTFALIDTLTFDAESFIHWRAQKMR